MLVLSRKTGESIKIADDITISVVEIRGNRVKLGISAPLSCTILRGELGVHEGSYIEVDARALGALVSAR